MISFSTTLSPGMLSTPSRRNAGLKPISSGSPRKSQGSDSRPSPTSWVCAETVSSPGRERQPQRRAAGQHLDAGDHVGELGARQRDLVLERLGQQPPELGELPLDAAGAEPDVPVPNSTWFSSTTISSLPSLDRRRRCGRDPTVRARHDRRQLLGRAALELRRAHRHAIGVGRGHRRARRRRTRRGHRSGRGANRRSRRRARRARRPRGTSLRRRRRCGRGRPPAAAGSHRRS